MQHILNIAIASPIQYGVVFVFDGTKLVEQNTLADIYKSCSDYMKTTGEI